MLAKVFSAGLIGIDAYPIEIEVDVSWGLPKEVVVGLPDTAVKESKDRVRAALCNSGFSYPEDKVTVNLAPADVKKEGPSFDLPIALGMLSADGKMKQNDFSSYVILGELALTGEVRPVKGMLSVALAAKRLKAKTLIVPKRNGPEAAIVDGAEVRGVESLSEAVKYLEGEAEIPPVVVDLDEIFSECSRYPVDFSEVKGQESAKRAIEVGVAGGHNILMVGTQSDIPV